MPGCAFCRTSGDRRSGLLSREIRGRGRRDRRYPGRNGENPHVPCAQEIGGTLEVARSGTRLAMSTTNNDESERRAIEDLLPWHAAGTLSRRDTKRVEEALARDPELARRYELVREELAGTVELNETLGAPS